MAQHLAPQGDLTAWSGIVKANLPPILPKRIKVSDITAALSDIPAFFERPAPEKRILSIKIKRKLVRQQVRTLRGAWEGVEDDPYEPDYEARNLLGDIRRQRDNLSQETEQPEPMRFQEDHLTMDNAARLALLRNMCQSNRENVWVIDTEHVQLKKDSHPGAIVFEIAIMDMNGRMILNSLVKYNTGKYEMAREVNAALSARSDIRKKCRHAIRSHFDKMYQKEQNTSGTTILEMKDRILAAGYNARKTRVLS